ncbi:MAG TPA: GTPase ObgE [Candidatus Borkfalkia excrementigallinarum]|uniref:GTPase Obg n=1 Tax=Candidatus Borkfalkia excrementigallinarum TaxID=2838506 RepID=A0A9D1ZWA9_9FIRM|nr:GTPase ObgE [Candidatus Borkfalkia excrementigallinarum]
MASLFTDKVKITIKSGDGGDGMNSFKSFKGFANGGPDGGDGGKGGDVYVVGDKDKGDLTDYRFGAKFAAGNGERGGTNNCFGKGGEDVVFSVPLGTLVRDAETGKILCDVYTDGEKILLARGGRGGKGNVRFTTARRHAPHFAQKGERTQPHTLILELKVIADVGLIGFPNVGKSTLLSKISAAKPKIANYHFTTLSPNLGVVKYYDKSFVAADIPGLIEGAADGAGLGHDFLRHIERTRMLVHVVDISGVEGRDPWEDFKKINAELKEYSEKLASLPQLVALNKCDIYGAEENLKTFRKRCRGKYKLFPITAVTGEGTRELIEGIFEVLDTLPPAEPVPADEFEYERADINEFFIDKDEEENVWYVTGGLVDMLERNVVLNDPDSMAYFQKVLKDKGVIKALRERGVAEDDTVVVGGVEFAFKN